MSKELQPDRRARLTALKAKLAAREGKKEYAASCEAIRAEIANVERSILSVDASDL